MSALISSFSNAFSSAVNGINTAITYVKGTPSTSSDFQFATEEYNDMVVVCNALPTTQLATQTVADYVELSLALSTPS
jgi:hypothetical protein